MALGSFGKMPKMPGNTSRATGIKLFSGINPGVKALRKIKFPRPKLPTFGKRGFKG